MLGVRNVQTYSEYKQLLKESDSFINYMYTCTHEVNVVNIAAKVSVKERPDKGLFRLRIFKRRPYIDKYLQQGLQLFIRKEKH